MRKPFRKQTEIWWIKISGLEHNSFVTNRCDALSLCEAAKKAGLKFQSAFDFPWRMRKAYDKGLTTASKTTRAVKVDFQSADVAGFQVVSENENSISEIFRVELINSRLQ